MTLIEAMKADKIDRVINIDGTRWMFWADETSFWEADHWVVIGKVGRKTHALIVTQDEEEAVKWLVGEEGL